MCSVFLCGLTKYRTSWPSRCARTATSRPSPCGSITSSLIHRNRHIYASDFSHGISLFPQLFAVVLLSFAHNLAGLAMAQMFHEYPSLSQGRQVLIHVADLAPSS